MMRAVVFAARLDFDIDQPILDAIEIHRHEIGKAAPARLVEEYFKILRSGYAEKSFQLLKENAAAPRDHAGARRRRTGALGVDRAPRSLSRSDSPRRPTR